MKSRTFLLATIFNQPFIDFSKQCNLSSIIKTIKKYIIYTLLAFISALFITFVFINLIGYRPIYGTGVSMKPTFDYFTYLLIDTNDTKPDYGDIISVTIKKNDERFDSYRDTEGILEKTSRLSKRVIALPGDDVIISKNNIFVNGEMVTLKGNKIQNTWNPTGYYDMMIEDIDGYFVIGDNLAESMDSTVFGIIYEDNIDGTVCWYAGSKFLSSILD